MLFDGAFKQSFFFSLHWFLLTSFFSSWHQSKFYKCQGQQLSRNTLGLSRKKQGKLFELTSDIDFHFSFKRFWTYVQIFAIMFITGPFEMFAMSSYNRHSLSRIFISILRCYSSLIAFAIFVLNDKSRKIIFKRYEVLENDQMS